MAKSAVFLFALLLFAVTALLGGCAAVPPPPPPPTTAPAGVAVVHDTIRDGTSTFVQWVDGDRVAALSGKVDVRKPVSVSPGRHRLTVVVEFPTGRMRMGFSALFQDGHSYTVSYADPIGYGEMPADRIVFVDLTAKTTRVVNAGERF